MHIHVGCLAIISSRRLFCVWLDDGLFSVSEPASERPITEPRVTEWPDRQRLLLLIVPRFWGHAGTPLCCMALPFLVYAVLPLSLADGGRAGDLHVCSFVLWGF